MFLLGFVSFIILYCKNWYQRLKCFQWSDLYCNIIAWKLFILFTWLNTWLPICHRTVVLKCVIRLLRPWITHMHAWNIMENCQFECVWGYFSVPTRKPLLHQYTLFIPVLGSVYWTDRIVSSKSQMQEISTILNAIKSILLLLQN